MPERKESSRVLTQERLLLGVLLTLLWLTRLSASVHPATPDLDPSWAQALGYALANGLQFGEDVVFTYGPLGWFAHSAWQSELWPWKLLFEWVFKLALLGVLVHGATRLGGPAEKLLFALVLLVPDPGAEAFYFASTVALGAWLLERADRHVGRSVPVWLLVAVIAWIKFTYLALVLAVAILVIVRAAFVVGRRQALLHSGIFVGLLLLVWSAAGQNPLNLPAYFAGSLAIARGYGAALSGPISAPDLWIALACLATGLAAVFMAWRPHGARECSLRLLLFASGGFLAFKAGFVSGGTTVITCFGYAFLAPWFLAWPTNDAAGEPANHAHARVRVLAGTLAVALGLLGYQRVQDASPNGTSRPFAAWNEFLAVNLQSVASLDEVPEAMRLERAALAASFALPRIRERIGADPADVLHSELAVLFLNDIAWRPRPIIQSYAAYTQGLAERNAEHFRSERAPRWVLWRFSTIDDRLPGADDGPATRELLRRYRPVLSESGYLLLERTEARALPAPRVVFERTVRFGERVELQALATGGVVAGHAPDNGVNGNLGISGGILHVDVRSSTRGALSGFLLSTPRVEIEIETSSGARANFRLVPEQGRDGFLLDPWLAGQGTWENAFAGAAEERVTAFRIDCEDADRGAFEEEIALRWVRHDGLLPPRDEPLLHELAYAMFDRAPSSKRESLPFERLAIEGRSALLVHAPSELVFDLEPGRWRIEAGFGLLPPGDGTICTDGAAFAIVLRNARGDGAVWRELLEPATRAEDRAPQTVDQDIELPVGNKLVLRTNVGTKGDGACDWCYWSGVHFRRLGGIDR